MELSPTRTNDTNRKALRLFFIPVSHCYAFNKTLLFGFIFDAGNSILLCERTSHLCRVAGLCLEYKR
jgi:hypothetical protein